MAKRHTRCAWLAVTVVLLVSLFFLQQDEREDKKDSQQVVVKLYPAEKISTVLSTLPWIDERLKLKLAHIERVCIARLSQLYFGVETTSLQDVCQYYRRNKQLLPNNAYLNWSLTPGSIYLRQVDYYRCRRRVLLVVHSSPSEDTLRSVWRRALTQYQKSSQMPQHICAALVFVIGTSMSTSLEKEASSHSDILQSDFIDSYANLTHKALSWLHFFCRRKDAMQPRELRNMQSLIVKVDSDTVVNFNAFFSLLDAYFDAEELEDVRSPKKVACYVWEQPKVDDTVDSAWRVQDRVVYTKSQWPPYCAGFFYALAPDTACVLSEWSPVLPIISIDDVYITGLVRTIARVALHHWNQHLPMALTARHNTDGSIDTSEAQLLHNNARSQKQLLLNG